MIVYFVNDVHSLQMPRCRALEMDTIYAAMCER